MIKASLELMRQTRINYLQIVKDMSIDQLNRIPHGFNNNLAWNFGHIVVTLPLLTYGLSGLPLPVDNELVSRYRRGSRPEKDVDEAEWRMLQEVSELTMSQVEQDYQAGLFQEYKAYTTTYGYSLTSVEAAIQFAPVHEGLHLGYAMAMIKKMH